MMLDCDFEKILTDLERHTWFSVKAVIINFLGNTKTKNYKHLVNSMLQNFQENEVNMSLKMHIFHSYLDSFTENFGAVSDENREGFY